MTGMERRGSSNTASSREAGAAAAWAAASLTCACFGRGHPWGSMLVPKPCWLKLNDCALIGCRFFGGGFGGGGQQEEQTPRGHDVYADLYVTLKDLYLGKELKVVHVIGLIQSRKKSRAFCLNAGGGCLCAAYARPWVAGRSL